MNTDNYAYVTLLANHLYFRGVVALAKSIKEQKLSYPVHCLVTEEVNNENRIELEKLGMIVREVPKISGGTAGDNDDKFMFDNWVTYTKLHIFNLTEFDKVIYLDADCIVLENIDDAFNFPSLSGYCLAHTGELEAGMVILSPDKKHFEDLMRYKDVRNYANHDQTLIDWYFIKNGGGEFYEIHNSYHVMQKPPHNKIPSLLTLNGAKVLEYNRSKPWLIENEIVDYQYKDDPWHDVWWKYYEK